MTVSITRVQAFDPEHHYFEWVDDATGTPRSGGVHLRAGQVRLYGGLMEGIPVELVGMVMDAMAEMIGPDDEPAEELEPERFRDTFLRLVEPHALGLAA